MAMGFGGDGLDGRSGARAGRDPATRLRSMLAGALTMLVLGSVVALALRMGGDEDTTATDATSTTASGDAAPAGPTTSTAETGDAALAGPWVRATLTGKDFVLSGTVPDGGLAADLLASSTMAYSPYLRSDLAVDEQIGAADWLAATPQAVMLIPSITEGTILFHDGSAHLSGTAPDQGAVDRLATAIGEVTGLPVTVDAMELSGLATPSYTITANGGQVVLGGTVPTEEIRTGLHDGAVAAYGADQVADTIVVDAGVYPSLWMYSGGQLLTALSAFPDYELKIEGTAFSGFLSGGFTFESNSAEFSPEFARVLDVGVGVLARDHSLGLTVRGHSDASGDAGRNLALSQERAEAVVAYFVERGIDPARLEAVGVGSDEPIAPNDTDEGRARNRRIEFVLR